MSSAVYQEQGNIYTYKTAHRARSLTMSTEFKTLADVRKTFTDEQLVKLAAKELKNREYHKAHNKKVREGYKLAVANGLVK